VLISVDDLAHVLTDASRIVVVDVRERDEIERTGVIPTAQHIPLDVLASALVNIPLDTTVVCVCATGIRAEIAVERLQTRGFAHVCNVLGGMKKWIASGYACDKPYVCA
jgi:rhodanese-related sulfurtransferase